LLFLIFTVFEKFSHFISFCFSNHFRYFCVFVNTDHAIDSSHCFIDVCYFRTISTIFKYFFALLYYIFKNHIILIYDLIFIINGDKMITISLAEIIILIVLAFILYLFYNFIKKAAK
jgi:hypothetical protein